MKIRGLNNVPGRTHMMWYQEKKKKKKNWLTIFYSSLSHFCMYLYYMNRSSVTEFQMGENEMCYSARADFLFLVNEINLNLNFPGYSTHLRSENLTQ